MEEPLVPLAITDDRDMDYIDPRLKEEADLVITCGLPAASFIPRWGMSFACVLEKGHDGPCTPGGTCYTHGKYEGMQCPLCPWSGAPNAIPQDTLHVATTSPDVDALIKERDALREIVRQVDEFLIVDEIDPPGLGGDYKKALTFSAVVNGQIAVYFHEMDKTGATREVPAPENVLDFTLNREGVGYNARVFGGVPICGVSEEFPGWWCSRDPGHTGPCALRPVPEGK